eukprot:m.192462 g.192462  ORF g.192462 m.192462 type:complete len:258 (-) comp18648_c0_seq1:1219-1992(-)
MDGTVGDGRRIQVIGAGLGRTGTMSLQAALDSLGYKTYHYPQPAHAETFARLAEGRVGPAVAFGLVVDSGHTATCDQPAADFFAEQLRLYPDAKVVLTVRDTGAKWAASWKVLMRFIEVQERPFSLMYPTFIQWIPFMRAWKRMRGVMGTHLGLAPGELIRGWRDKRDPDAWLIEQYDAHNTLVRQTVPKEQLLVFNVKDGWGPLCEFLGKDVPDGPFPFVNESADLAWATNVMIVASYGWIPVVAIIVASVARLMR